MTSIYTQETMLFHTTFYVTNRSAECGIQENVAVLREDIEKLKRLGQEFEQETSPRIYNPVTAMETGGLDSKSKNRLKNELISV